MSRRARQDLLQQCRQSIERIRKDLQSHRKLLDGIADMHAAAEQAKLFSVQASDLDTPPPDGMTAMVARSTLELLLTQSVRLQGLNEELREARRALDERKQVERAKQQLMRQQGCSEGEAYGRLRQAAMNRGLRTEKSPAPAGVGRFGEHGRTRPALPALKTGTPCRPGPALPATVQRPASQPAHSARRWRRPASPARRPCASTARAKCLIYLPTSLSLEHSGGADGRLQCTLAQLSQ